MAIPVPAPGRVLALQQVRRTGSELDDFNAPLYIAQRVVDRLAMLTREDPGAGDVPATHEVGQLAGLRFGHLIGHDALSHTSRRSSEILLCNQNNVRRAYRVLVQVADDLTTSDPADRFVLAIEPHIHVGTRRHRGVVSRPGRPPSPKLPASAETATGDGRFRCLPLQRRSHPAKKTCPRRCASGACSSQRMN